ncbi:unnamed protein product, partial [Amoebophrya sp. A25]
YEEGAGSSVGGTVDGSDAKEAGTLLQNVSPSPSGKPSGPYREFLLFSKLQSRRWPWQDVATFLDLVRRVLRNWAEGITPRQVLVLQAENNAGLTTSRGNSTTPRGAASSGRGANDRPGTSGGTFSTPRTPLQPAGGVVYETPQQRPATSTPRQRTPRQPPKTTPRFVNSKEKADHLRLNQQHSEKNTNKITSTSTSSYYQRKTPGTTATNHFGGASSNHNNFIST